MTATHCANALRTRPAKTDDLPRIATLFNAYRQFYEKAADFPLCYAYISERLQRGDSVILVAEQDASLVGFCQIYPGYCSVLARPIGTLYDLYVCPEARRCGAGRALLQAAEAYGRAQGMARLDLTTAKTNSAAQSLYASQAWLRDDVFLIYNRTL